jgi:hypothetical protein
VSRDIWKALLRIPKQCMTRGKLHGIDNKFDVGSKERLLSGYKTKMSEYPV